MQSRRRQRCAGNTWKLRTHKEAFRTRKDEGGIPDSLRTSANYFGFVCPTCVCVGLFTLAWLPVLFHPRGDNNLINVSSWVCKFHLPKLKMRPPCPFVVDKSSQVFIQSHHQISKFVKLIFCLHPCVCFQLNNCHYKNVSISPTTNCTRSQHFMPGWALSQSCPDINQAKDSGSSSPNHKKSENLCKERSDKENC